jgi:hypothetical protein
LELCGGFLEKREDQLYAAAEAHRHRWWIPKAVNRQIARAIIRGIRELLTNLQKPGNPARQNLIEAIEELTSGLCTSPVFEPISSRPRPGFSKMLK